MIETIKNVITESSQVLILVALLILNLTGFATFADADEKKTVTDPHPLRTADTSSPRDTLNSFLSNSKQYIKDFREDTRNAKTYRAYRRASKTFDFSTTPEGGSWFIRNQRMALLYELLARIELPKDNEIPGDEEVADGSITQWTIPNTSITIVKFPYGPKAGQFLFSASTVQQLDSLYRQSKHLPYKPGTTVGIYESMVNTDTRIQGQERHVRNRLKPVDTSSPRSTLEGFLDSVNRAYVLVMETNAKLQANPPTITKEEAREIEVMAANQLQRAIETLDLSQVPKARRQDVSIETVLQLKEVFDRMLLPPIGAIPNADVVAAARGESGGLSWRSSGPFRWRYPNTQIEIVEIMDGEQQGQFLFSSSTIQRIGTDYQKIRDLPYRHAELGGTELEHLSPGLSPGFYEEYISTPGYIIPQAYYLGRLVAKLPDWFLTERAGQSVWQWIGLILSVLVTILFAYAVYHYINRMAKRMKSPLYDWLKLLAPIIVFLTVIAVGGFIDDVLNFTGDLQAAITTSISAITFALAAWVVYVFCKAFVEAIIATPRMRELSSEAALLRIGARVVGFLIGAWIVIDGIKTLGADLIPLLAGLGIGGIAVALAAKTTIENFISGLILFANKPVRVGDFCRYGEDPSADWRRIGTVEEIGLISTRIRGLDRAVTTIPNAEFANMHIINLSKRDRRLLRTKLQLRYETTSEQMRYILINIRELLLGHPMVTAEPARVRFRGYSDYSKDVEIFCYLKCREHNEFLAIQEDVLLRIEDIIKDAGSGFAFPSQTAYLARDTGLDDEQRDKAETEVGHLRFTGKLPFPEFDEEDREQLEDILDYPPKGSPDYTST